MRTILKKLLGIVVLGLFLSSNAYAVTIYCDHEEWNHYVILNIDYKNKLVQGDKFGGGVAIKALISEKTITFSTQDEQWKINRINGKVYRTSYTSDINQIGLCSTKKPGKKLF